jgi:hypothetical protein
MLAKHREIETCADCHRKIDPLGFAMEHFDAIGQWREAYDSKGKNNARQPIDVTGQLPNGTAINGFQDMKEKLLLKPEQVAQALSEKLMKHAMGRYLGVVERSDVDRVVHQAKQYEYKVVDLIAALCATDIFINGGK